MTDTNRLKYSRKMIGKRVCVLEPGGYYYGIVGNTPEWDVFIIETPHGKREVSIFDIRSIE
jgi:hypothetical protein